MLYLPSDSTVSMEHESFQYNAKTSHKHEFKDLNQAIINFHFISCIQFFDIPFPDSLLACFWNNTGFLLYLKRL